MRRTVLGLAIALLAAAPAGADHHEGTVKSTGPATAMEQADKNHDGTLDHAEFHDRQVEVFYLVDRDKDGVLTATELGEVDTDRFTVADRDRNGTLSLREFEAARFKDFEHADTDDDEVLTAVEIEAATPAASKRK